MGNLSPSNTPPTSISKPPFASSIQDIFDVFLLTKWSRTRVSPHTPTLKVKTKCVQKQNLGLKQPPIKPKLPQLDRLLEPIHDNGPTALFKRKCGLLGGFGEVRPINLNQDQVPGHSG